MPEQKYKIRTFDERRDLQDIFRVQLNQTALVKHGLEPGSICMLDFEGRKTLMAVAWAAAPKLDELVLKVSMAFQDMNQLKLADRCSIRRADLSVKSARLVTLVEVNDQTRDEQPTDTYVREAHSADGYGRNDQCISEIQTQYLQKLHHITVGMMFKDIESRHSGGKSNFKIVKIDPESTCKALYRYGAETNFEIKSERALEEEAKAPPRILDAMAIGGLAASITKLRSVMKRYSGSYKLFAHKSSFQPRSKGLLLYGPPGTGKSMLIDQIEEGDCRTFNASLEHLGGKGTAHIELTRVFDEAQRSQPSIVLIDSLEKVTDVRDERLMGALISALGNLRSAQVLVIAAGLDPKDMEKQLRRSGFFSLQIEVPPPDSKARAQILKLLNQLPKDEPNDVLDSLADRTHGFVGRDLQELVEGALEVAEERTLPEHDFDRVYRSWIESNEAEDKRVKVDILQEDYERALKAIKPSAMQEVFLEVPKVRWTDIGGQEHIKTALQQAVEWPIKYSHRFGPLGVEAQKGMLLYGPPGCSKTLIARAIATEAGLNFLAVKGADILSMYVGESERALREIFNKARAASPSILFFDEIDAIGGSRDSQHTGLNVLTTMLNEMDGIEALNGVFILAATNRPETLDSALMRPGRLDKHMYVGPPNLSARRDIFRIRLSGKAVAEDVDFESLAEDTAGHSGSEVVNICRNAGLAALEDEIKEGRPDKIQKRHLEAALREEKRQITADMVESYQAWGQRAANR